jgi:hypothetical protein
MPDRDSLICLCELTFLRIFPIYASSIVFWFCKVMTWSSSWAILSCYCFESRLTVLMERAESFFEILECFSRWKVAKRSKVCTLALRSARANTFCNLSAATYFWKCLTEVVSCAPLEMEVFPILVEAAIIRNCEIRASLSVFNFTISFSSYILYSTWLSLSRRSWVSASATCLVS